MQGRKRGSETEWIKAWNKERRFEGERERSRWGYWQNKEMGMRITEISRIRERRDGERLGQGEGEGGRWGEGEVEVEVEGDGERIYKEKK